MLIFNQEERVRLEPARYSEGSYHYLNTSARPEFASARLTLEAWFRRYPGRHQRELLCRLKSSDDDAHRSAVFELFLHELLLRIGAQVEVHPELPDGQSTRPDFLAQLPNGTRFYLEAALCYDASKEKRTAEARLARALDAIDQLPSPNFFLEVKAVNWLPRTQVPVRRLRHELDAWLQVLDPDEVAREYDRASVLPGFTFVHDGFPVRFEAIPKKPSARGKKGSRVIGMGPCRGRIVTVSQAIKRKVAQKAGYYGDLGHPYVVAIQVVPFGVDSDDCSEALYGRSVGVCRSLDHWPQTLITDGAWAYGGQPQNTRVSSALIVSSLCLWDMTHTQGMLFANPWAKLPIGIDALPTVTLGPPVTRGDAPPINSYFMREQSSGSGHENGN